MPPLRALRFAIPVLAVLACAPRPSGVEAPSPFASPRGTLFIVGGGTQPKPLVEHFVALAGGAGHARIAVIPMASEEAQSTGDEKAADLRALGAESFVVNVARAEADDEAVVGKLAQATGVWFTGGDQARLVRALAGSKALREVHARYAAGAVIGGTSAGAAIMSDSMITGDQRRPGVDTVGYFGDEYLRIARATIVVTTGFGFLHGAIVDQHFIKRERQNRLMSAVLERPTMLGVGIDEGTALRVDPDGTWTVEGASAAIVYDARAADITPTSAPRLGATSMRVHLLPAGSTFDPRTGGARLPRG